MKYAVLTFGCRVNQADSLGFEEELTARGASPADLADADLVVVNTCSVTASADQAARQAIRRVSRINASARVVVTGCYATRRPDELRDLPNVANVVCNDDKPRLLQIALSGLTTATRFADGEGSCGASIEPGVAGRTAFTLRVQTGCSESCAYCVIPTTRGEPRSRPIAEVAREAVRVAAAGFKEIAITGVHLGSYGRDLEPRASLGSLLHALADLGQPDTLFRVSSLEPMDCTSEIVSLVARDPAFAPHFHLPLQHASNRMLRAMRRPYGFEYFRDLVADIRVRMPLAAIGSDVIVGFPGETDDDFEELARYLESSPLTHLHVFPYSPRPGTAAAGMSDPVPGVLVRERGTRLRQISERLSRQFKARQTGVIHRALTIDDGSTVVTGNYLKLRIDPGIVRNEWVQVRVDDVDAKRGTVVAEFASAHGDRQLLPG